MIVESAASPSYAVREPRPTLGDVVSSLARRAVVPGLVSALVLFAIGWLIMGPLGGLTAEEEISKSAARGRTAAMDQVTHVWSSSTDTFTAIGLGIAFSLAVWALSRRWWWGLAPIAALTLESSVFVPVTNIVDRPRPDVLFLDAAPPTSSFPSGHTAAAFALYLTLALLAARIPWRLPRLVVQVACVVCPFLVAYARLYRGMHHLSDIVIGALFGIWCAWTIAHALPGVWPFGRTAVDREVRARALDRG